VRNPRARCSGLCPGVLGRWPGCWRSGQPSRVFNRVTRPSLDELDLSRTLNSRRPCSATATNQHPPDPGPWIRIPLRQQPLGSSTPVLPPRPRGLIPRPGQRQRRRELGVAAVSCGPVPGRGEPSVETRILVTFHHRTVTRLSTTLPLARDSYLVTPFRSIYWRHGGVLDLPTSKPAGVLSGQCMPKNCRATRSCQLQVCLHRYGSDHSWPKTLTIKFPRPPSLKAR
jgi:hypothetical protein